MPVIRISNGTIEEISSERDTTFVTITYMEGSGNRRRLQTVRLVVRPRTIILNTNGVPVSPYALRVGMIINASFSSAMTRSIPPQATAYSIRIIRRAIPDSVTVGRILEIDRNNMSFTTISNQERSSVIRFNVNENTRYFDRFGRPANFFRLGIGMRVRVVHANFMTASIPPQTTAFEVHMV